MKCDELKDYDYDPDFPFQSRGRFYDADEVDEAIAELKDENQRLVKCCKEYDSRQRINENIQFNAAKQLRKTKRALWIARADRAKERQNYESGCRSDGWVRRENMWLEVERLCRHKAEEYK